MIKKVVILDQLLKNGESFEIRPYPHSEEGNYFSYEECLSLIEKKIYEWNPAKSLNYLLPLLQKLTKEVEIETLSSEKRKGFFDRCKRIQLRIEEIFLTERNRVLFDQEKTLAKIQKTMFKIGEHLISEFGPECEDKKYEFLTYLLFEKKDLGWVNQILSKFPDVMQLSNNKGKTLFDETISSYLEEVKNYTTEKETVSTTKLVYYEKVLELMNSKKASFSLKAIFSKINEVKTQLDQTNEESINRETKRKKIFWYNRMLEQLNQLEPEKDFPYYCYKHNISSTFDQGVLSEARKCKTTIFPRHYPNRPVLEDFIVTIDSPGAKELDDALSAKILDNGNVLLGVHITDVASILPEQSIIVDEALARGTSIYLRDFTIGMFDDRFGKGLFSLNEGQYRLAFSYFSEINKAGQIENFSIKKTIIKVNRNLGYDQAEKRASIVMGTSEEEQGTWRALFEAKKRLDKRICPNQIYQMFQQTEVSITQNRMENTGKFSTGIVEKAMIVTGEQASKKAYQEGIPWIYRNHKVDPRIAEEMTSISKNVNTMEKRGWEKLAETFRNTMPKARYSSNLEGHFGLGIETYSHVTSPIRRGSDLMNQYNLHQFYFEQQPREKIQLRTEYLETFSKQINLNRFNVEEFIKKVDSIKILTKS